MSDFNLGTATAYGYAKDKGYTGTEQEFAELMASYASVAESAAASAEAAAASATTATTKASEASASATTATNAKTAAETAATTASTKAGEASTSATTATTKAGEAATSASTASTKATEAANSATSAAGSATTATTKAGEAATSATNAAASAAAAAQSAATLVIDATLTHSGQAADAKATGDAITALKDDLSLIDNVSFEVSEEEETSVQTASGWRLNESDGLCSSNSNYKLVKYDALAGTYLRITTDDRFQFQNSPSVPSTGNNNRVGKTYQAGTYYVLVPSGATFLIVSTLISNGNISVKKAEPMFQADVKALETDMDFIHDDLYDSIVKSSTDLGASVTTFDSWSAGGWAHNGYRMPIKGSLTFRMIAFKTSVSADTDIIISILDKSLNVLATKTVSAITTDRTVTAIFGRNVTVPDDFGFVEILCTNAKVGYNTATSEIDNTDVFPTPTSDNRGYFNDNGTAWARLSTSQTYTFHVPFRIYDAEIEYVNKLNNIIEIGAGKAYTTLRAGFEAAYARPNTKVVVYDGQYDLAVEFADAFVDHLTRGIALGNGMHAIFMPGAFVTCILDGSDSWAHSQFNPFYAGDGDYIIDGLNIKCQNTRYCVHDEKQGNGTYKHEYINCRMEQTDTMTEAYYPQCIGGGLGRHGYIDVVGGYYKSSATYAQSGYTSADDMQQPITYHNGTNANCYGRICIRDVYLADKGYFRFGCYGNATQKTPVQISGCRIGKPTMLMYESNDFSNNNFEIISYGNTVIDSVAVTHPRLIDSYE